jgi:hypothetical protein
MKNLEVGEPDLPLLNLMNGVERLPRTWTPKTKKLAWLSPKHLWVHSPDIERPTRADPRATGPVAGSAKPIYAAARSAPDTRG